MPLRSFRQEPAGPARHRQGEASEREAGPERVRADGPEPAPGEGLLAAGGMSRGCQRAQGPQTGTG